jgi:hypothetical protein
MGAPIPWQASKPLCQPFSGADRRSYTANGLAPVSTALLVLFETERLEAFKTCPRRRWSDDEELRIVLAKAQ